MTDVASGYVVEQNAIEVMRNDLRETATINRKNKRTNELNKHRVALGEVENIEILWDREKLIVKANELKKKPLKISDYRRLQTALLQNEDNINGFFTVNNIIPAIIRDLTSSNPTIQMTAAHCCCNISLGNLKRCRTLCKYVGPYLIEQLDTLNNPLLEISLWTIGNLCSGSKEALKILHAQGGLNHLLSLLRDSDIMILPSIIYAVTHYLNGGSDLMGDTEAVLMAKIIINRGCFDLSTGLWVIALLSSRHSCTETLTAILSPVFDEMNNKINDQAPDTKYITAAIRFLGNMVPEVSGYAADIILNNEKYSIQQIQEMFDKLLLYSYIHVRKETLWLLGNLYNHQQPRINQGIKNLLPQLTNLKYAIQSVSC